MNSTSTSSISIPGPYIEFILIGYNEFNKNKNTIENYTIKVIDKESDVEVVFVPKSDLTSGPVLGGRTSYGREVHFLISKKDKTLVKKHFSR